MAKIEGWCQAYFESCTGPNFVKFWNLDRNDVKNLIGGFILTLLKKPRQNRENKIG